MNGKSGKVKNSFKIKFLRFSLFIFCDLRFFCDSEVKFLSYMNPVGSRRVYFVNAKLKVQNEKCKIKVVAEGDFQNFKF